MAISGEGNPGPLVDDPKAVRDEWLERLNALATQVKGWAEASRWRTRMVSKSTRDPVLGRYDVPLLLMERDGIEVALNPVSRFVPGADGAVDLYVVPAYDEVAGLYVEDGTWSVYYVFHEDEAAGIREPKAMPLTKATIVRVLDAMAERDA